MKGKNLFVCLLILAACFVLPSCGNRAPTSADAPSPAKSNESSSDSEAVTNTAGSIDNALYNAADQLDKVEDAVESDASGLEAMEDDLKPDTAVEEKNPAAENEEPETYTLADLSSLRNTQYFLPSAIEHIFSGSINRKGNATGYHYEGITDSAGRTVDGSKSQADENGIYEGRVEVNGIAKSGNGGYSSFFPESMTPQDVIDAINEAYENRQQIGDSLYAGLTDEGIEIDMALTDDGKIITAYPVMEN